MHIQDDPIEHADGPGMPERRLMSAILWEAFHSLQRPTAARIASGDPLRREILDWFHTDQLDYVFSFRSICAYLEIDPVRIRAQVEVVAALARDRD